MTATATHAKPELPVNPSADRFGRAEGAEPVIIRDGGRFNAGIIKGVSLASVGEAKGHGLWLDSETISQIEKLSISKGESGLKSRFAHPSMSSDSIGRHLGRLHDVRIEGDKVIGDLHFVTASHSTPDGDLAEYCMTLAEDDPTSAGLSIVFHHDWDSEEAFIEINQEEYEDEDHRGRKFKSTRFKSPDPNNVNNYPHVRLHELRAADLVDEPASGSGLFHANSLPSEADEFLSYAAGISTKKPMASAFGVDGDRASQFLNRWLESHGLSIVPKEPALATQEQTDAPENVSEVVTQTREDFSAELAKFTSKFGSENGSKWFTENKSFQEALSLHCEALSTQLTAAAEACEELEAKLSSLQLGETEPVATGASDSTENKPARFADAFASKSKKS